MKVLTIIAKYQHDEKVNAMGYDFKLGIVEHAAKPLSGMEETKIESQKHQDQILFKFDKLDEEHKLTNRVKNEDLDVGDVR